MSSLRLQRSPRHHRAVLLAALALETASLGATSCAESNGEHDTVDAADIPPRADAGLLPVDASGDGSKLDATDATPEGTDWYPVTTSHDPRLGLSAIWGTGKNDVWAVGAAGSILHWDGVTWSSASIDTRASLNAIGGTVPNDIWVASSVSGIFHVRGFEGGVLQWSAAPSIAPFADERFLFAVWAAAPGDVWLAGQGVDLGIDPSSSWRSQTTEDGLVWEPASRTEFSLGNGFTAPTIYGIWGSGDDDVWCVGSKAPPNPASFSVHSDGSLTEDGMPVWTELDTQSNGPLNAIWAADATEVWAVGDYGTIRRFRGAPVAGAAWEVIPSPTTEHLRGLWGASRSDIWAVGDHGTFLHYDGDAGMEGGSP